MQNPKPRKKTPTAAAPTPTADAKPREAVDLTQPAEPLNKEEHIAAAAGGAALAANSVGSSAGELPENGQRAVVARRTKRIPPGTTHDLVTKVRHHFLKSRGHDSGLLRPFNRLLVDIIVSEALLDDTLELANQLFLKFTSKGHHVTIPATDVRGNRMEVDERETPKPVRWRSQVWVPDRPTVVYIDEVPIGLTLFEMTEDVEMVYVSGDYIAVDTLTPLQQKRYVGPHHWNTTKSRPSGRRCLQVYSTHFRYSWSRQWRESKPGQLTKLLSEVVRELESVVPQMRVGIAEAERQAEEERQKRQAEWEAQRVKERCALETKVRESARVDFLKAIEAWDEVRRIAAFFDAAEKHVQGLEADTREPLAARLALARELVGQPNPLAVLASWASPQERLKAELQRNTWLLGSRE